MQVDLLTAFAALLSTTQMWEKVIVLPKSTDYELIAKVNVVIVLLVIKLNVVIDVIAYILNYYLYFYYH